MSRLKALIQEIHRRSLLQVLGIYVAVSWVVFQVVQTLTEGLGLPDWVPPWLSSRERSNMALTRFSNLSISLTKRAPYAWAD